MERTNYVAKAKSLMLSAARTTALVIVPLAAAVSAQATPVTSIALPIGSFACSTIVNSGSGACAGGDFQQASLGTGVQGLSFFTSGGQVFSLSSGSGQEIVLTMTDHGTTSGLIPQGTVIPVGGIFVLTTSGGASVTGWALSFGLGPDQANETYAFVSGSGTSGGTQNPSYSLDVTSNIPASSTLWETAQLFVFVDDAAGTGGLTINVPAVGTFDFNSVAATTAPEPGSLGMLGTGLALAAAWFRRRRKS